MKQNKFNAIANYLLLSGIAIFDAVSPILANWNVI